MKSLTLSIIVMMMCTMIVPSTQNAISMPDLSPQDLYKQSNMVFYGQVVSAGPGSRPDSNYYLLKIVTSFKNSQKSDYITVEGNKTGTGIKYPQFENGDNAIFYIQKINGINTISPYSQIAGNECDIHSFLGPAPLPDEPIMRGGPVSRIYISDLYGNFPEKFPVNHHIVLSSSDILNSYPEARTITIEMSILDSNEQKIFYKKQGWGYRACDGPGVMHWDFVPTQSGQYTAILVVDNKTTISTSFDVNGSNVNNAQLVSSPLQQFKFGIESNAVQCSSNLKLIIRSENVFPACVQSSSIARLLAHGWKLPEDTSLQNIQTQFQSKLMTKENAIKISQEYARKQNKTGIMNYSNSEIQTNLVYYITTSFPRVPVDYGTGIPTRVMDWLDEYYQNPQWWTELEKGYLGLPNHRIESGHVVWELDYGRCDHCLANSPMIFVDAITGKVIDTKWLY